MAQQYHLPLPQKEAMSLEDFLVSPANEEAVQWLLSRTPAEWPSHVAVLRGPEGSGKTHLLHIWCERVGAAKAALGDTALLSKIVEGNAPAAAFAIDDVDKGAGHAAQEEWLQHFFNATKAAQIPVLLIARQPVVQWGLTLRDIETRLKSCLSLAIHEPDDELIRGLFLKLFADRQLLVETGVVDYLAQRVDRTGGAIRAMVTILDEAALQSGRKISVPFAQKALAQHKPEAEDDDGE